MLIGASFILRVRQRAQLLLEKSSRDDKLACSVHESLVVPEVASQANAAEYGFLDFAAQCVEHAVDADASLLLLHSPPLGLQPVHSALVALHCRQQVVDPRFSVRVWDAELNTLLDDIEFAQIDCFHAGALGQQ